jgi:hypothetical protein
MQYRSFEATVIQPEDGLPYIAVPSEVASWLNAGAQPLPVCGEASGLAYRSVLWPDPDDKGQWYVELNPEISASGRFENGRQIRASIAFDEEPREASIPYELTETLGMAALAEHAWDKLSEADRAPYCEWVAAATDPHYRWHRAERAAVLVRRGEKLEMSGHAS